MISDEFFDFDFEGSTSLILRINISDFEGFLTYFCRGIFPIALFEVEFFVRTLELVDMIVQE